MPSTSTGPSDCFRPFPLQALPPTHRWRRGIQPLTAAPQAPTLAAWPILCRGRRPSRKKLRGEDTRGRIPGLLRAQPSLLSPPQVSSRRPLAHLPARRRKSSPTCERLSTPSEHQKEQQEGSCTPAGGHAVFSGSRRARATGGPE